MLLCVWLCVYTYMNIHVLNDSRLWKVPVGSRILGNHYSALVIISHLFIYLLHLIRFLFYLPE